MEQNPFKPIEIVMGDTGTAPFLICVEHASNVLPPGWAWPKADEWIIDTHWAYDPGAADLARKVAEREDAVAVLGNFSRLFADPNRPLDSSTLFRDNAEGKKVLFNDALGEGEKQRRLDLCYHPYHQTLSRQCRNRRGQFLLAIHSFTPVYEGEKRELEVGILHVNQEEKAQTWADAFTENGFNTRINHPYSGKDGFMFGPQEHGDATGRATLMLEFRQDLLKTKMDQFVALIHECLVRTDVILS